MTSKELELELKLTQLNNKIKFYNKLLGKLPFKFLQVKLLKRCMIVVDERNKCFKELRELVRKKYPEKFISSEGS